jgi:hypothetical protein
VLSATTADDDGQHHRGDADTGDHAANKIYDATRPPRSAAPLTGVVGGDVVTCTGTGSFDSPRSARQDGLASNRRSVGAAASNYALSTTSATTTANITAVTLTPAITAANKTYDGTSTRRSAAR